MEDKIKSKGAEHATKLLALVTLYNPDIQTAAENIRRYIDSVDSLIVWDNSPLESEIRQKMQTLLYRSWHKIVWQGNGRNQCIAPAVNYAWKYAADNHFDLILLMDDDSRWDDFPSYRRKVEELFRQQGAMVFTPYVEGCDEFPIVDAIQQRKLFINSGTIIPTQILDLIGGVDEKAFPLDALDHDMALSILRRGKKIVCLTDSRLRHSLGNPARMGIFHLFTPNYNRHRTYSMTRSHLICYRKHRREVSGEYRKYVLREIIMWKFIRIVLAEPDKLGRLWALIRGIASGLNYKYNSTF